MDDGLMRAWMTRLERWVGLHPVAGSDGLRRVAEDIVQALEACGFEVEKHEHPSGNLLVATKRHGGPVLGLYGHYDVAPGGQPDLQIRGDRLHGRGVADNLGPLSLRLSVLERVRTRDVDMLWVIEPGEEIGSPALADWLASSGSPRADLWLDETGYFEAHGAQRILLVDADRRTLDVARQCAALAREEGRGTRIEHRRLHRVVAEAGFSVEALFRGAPYLAIGPNDDRSDVHGGSESLPLDTIDLAARQLQAVLEAFSTRGRA